MLVRRSVEGAGGGLKRGCGGGIVSRLRPGREDKVIFLEQALNIAPARFPIHALVRKQGTLFIAIVFRSRFSTRVA